MVNFNDIPNAGYIADMLGRAADLTYQAAERSVYWATVLRLVPYKDGDKWCVLYGDDLQCGIAGFGDTPEKAVIAFDIAWSKP